MKKSMSFLLGTALCATALLGAVACNNAEQPSSAKGFQLAGNLQTLYGEEGYPQAVIVAKKELTDTQATQDLISYLEGSEAYLQTATPETVLSLLADKRTEGMTATFNAKNLNQTVLENCSVRFTPSSECKEKVNGFLSELIAVNPKSASAVQDAFYYTGTQTAQAEGNYSVYAPDGAPALALCNAIAQNTENFTYHVIDASTVQTLVTGESPKADYCVLPVNLASKLLGTGEVYQMLGTVTNGNLYFLSTDGETLTKDNLSLLKGKTVGVINLANVPGMTLQVVLQKYQIEYQTITSLQEETSADKVNLLAVQATDVTPVYGCDYYLCPEPAATTKINATAKK